MEIYWDGYGLENPNSGVGSYARSLAKELTLLHSPPIVIGNQICEQTFHGIPILPLPKPGLFKFFANSKLGWSNRVEKLLTQKIINSPSNEKRQIILHGLSNINIPTHKNNLQNVKRVITIHDLIPLYAPNAVSRAYLAQFKYLLPKVIKQADCIICISKWTQASVLALYPKAANKIQLVPNGFQHFDTNQHFDKEPLNIGSKIHMLCVARYEKYKNLELLLEILFKKSNDFRLTLVTNSQGKEWAEKVGKTLINNNSLIVKTNISDQVLKDLYRDSHIYIHPSKYEGFCLPAAEALTFGTPVVYQAGSGIDETVGSTVGIPMNSKSDIYDWIKAIQMAANMRYKQHFLFDIGDHIANAPTWEKSAKALLDIYKGLF